MNENVMSLEDIKNKKKIEKKSVLENEFIFPYVDARGIPLKIWNNLDALLKHNDVTLKWNLINKEVESFGNITSSRNELLTDIHTLNIISGLRISRDEIRNLIPKIALQSKYNPFIDYLKENENDDIGLIEDVFNCLIINPDYSHNYESYFKYFCTWCINVVRQSHNTLELGYSPQGVLTLQGGQGCYKSTFFRELLPNNNWFKGGKVLDPSKTDSIKQNTKYIIVELGELDATLKSDQAKLKAFITEKDDEYRTPYASYEEKNPRITTFCATVNKQDFLKDETGSRRWWIIPVLRCDIQGLKKIDINKFWGSVYSLWKSGEFNYYLDAEETKKLNDDNIEFSAQNDISILLDDSFDWEQDKEKWMVYKITEIANALDIRERKSLKTELTRRGYKEGTHRQKENAKPKWGYKLPRLVAAAEYKNNSKAWR